MNVVNAKIVVGYNQTQSASEAVSWAAHEAVVKGVSLHIVLCFEMQAIASEASLGWGAGAEYLAVVATAETTASGLRTAFAASHPDLTLSVDVVAGPATTALLEGLEPDDLIVVGASSHSGAAAFWTGTTPRYLVHHSPCPVVVVRGSASRGAPDRVVVGVDGSPAADKALRWAGDEADRHGVELVIVHAWSYPYVPVDTAATQGRDLTRIDAACTLDRAAELAGERCGITVTPLLVEGSPVTALLEAAHDGDILVVGSRGRGAVRSRLFGSTAHSVLDASAVPIVVVRADPDDEPHDVTSEPQLGDG